MVSGHEEDVGELLAEAAEGLRELVEVVAHVPRQQQRVAQVSSTGKALHPRHVFRVVHVHVRQGEDPHGFLSAASEPALVVIRNRVRYASGNSEQLSPFVLSEAKSKDTLSHGERGLEPESFRGSFGVCPEGRGKTDGGWPPRETLDAKPIP